MNAFDPFRIESKLRKSFNKKRPMNPVLRFADIQFYDHTRLFDTSHTMYSFPSQNDTLKYLPPLNKALLFCQKDSTMD